MPRRGAQHLALILGPALAVILLDQVTKAAVLSRIAWNETVPVIPGFFDLVHVRNRGMAFGMLSGPDKGWGPVFLLGLSLLATGCLLFWLLRRPFPEPWTPLGLSMILGGATGNLCDRLRLGEVVDFLDVHVGSWHWPAFNVADAAITTGACLVALLLLLQTGDEKG